MLCNDCEQLPKCECCGKPIKDMTDLESFKIVNEVNAASVIAPLVKPIIPAIPMDDEKIPADQPRKKLDIKPAEEMNGLVDVFMKGW